MEIKLDFEQRHRANEMLERLAGEDDLEKFVFEFIATRDAYNKMRIQTAELKSALEHYAHGGSNYAAIARKALGWSDVTTQHPSTGLQ